MDVRILLIVLTFFFFIPVAHAEPSSIFTARVVEVVDGDTVDVMTTPKKIRIRLKEMDAPERNQPFSDESKEMLSAMVLNKDVVIVNMGTDHYGRTLGRIFPLESDVSYQMVKQGGAQVDPKYMTDKIFREEEKAAENRKDGLWALPVEQRIPPWNWRHGEKKETPK